MDNWNPKPNHRGSFIVFTLALAFSLFFLVFYKPHTTDSGNIKKPVVAKPLAVKPQATVSSSTLRSEAPKTSQAGKTFKDEKAKTMEVQRILAKHGFYKGYIDGKDGPLTKKAVKEFQASRRLHSDGVIGAKTWEALVLLSQ